MFIQECRRESNIYSTPVVTGFLQSSLLTQICYRGPVWHHVPDISGDTDIVVGREGCTEDKILPVCEAVTHEFSDPVTRRCSFRIDLSIEVHKLLRHHDGHLPRYLLHAYRTGVSDLRLACEAFLGGDDDHAVGCSGSIDCRCRGILEDCERLDVIGIEQVQRI